MAELIAVETSVCESVLMWVDFSLGYLCEIVTYDDYNHTVQNDTIYDSVCLFGIISSMPGASHHHKMTQFPVRSSLMPITFL